MITFSPRIEMSCSLISFSSASGFNFISKAENSFSNEFDPDLKVLPSSGKTIIVDQNKLEQIKALQGVQAFSKIIEERVLLSFDNKHTPANIKSIDKEYLNVNPVDSSLIGGVWVHPQENQVVIGSAISRKLSLGIGGYGDALKIMVPKPGKGQISQVSDSFSPKSKSKL